MEIYWEEGCGGLWQQMEGKYNYFYVVNTSVQVYLETIHFAVVENRRSWSQQKQNIM